MEPYSTYHDMKKAEDRSMCILSFVEEKFVYTKNISGRVHKKLIMVIPSEKESLGSGEGGRETFFSLCTQYSAKMK